MNLRLEQATDIELVSPLQHFAEMFDYMVRFSFIVPMLIVAAVVLRVVLPLLGSSATETSDDSNEEAQQSRSRSHPLDTLRSVVSRIERNLKSFGHDSGPASQLVHNIDLFKVRDAKSKELTESRSVQVFFDNDLAKLVEALEAYDRHLCGVLNAADRGALNRGIDLANVRLQELMTRDLETQRDTMVDALKVFEALVASRGTRRSSS